MPTDILEVWVAKKLDKILQWAGVTINSGAIKGDEDVMTPEYIIQCKRSSIKKNFIIDIKDWKQLQDAALTNKNGKGDYRTGVLVMENSASDRIAALEIGDFFYLLEELALLQVMARSHDKLVRALDKSGLMKRYTELEEFR